MRIERGVEIMKNGFGNFTLTKESHPEETASYCLEESHKIYFGEKYVGRVLMAMALIKEAEFYIKRMRRDGVLI
jgi:hypothetical protein